MRWLRETTLVLATASLLSAQSDVAVSAEARDALQREACQTELPGARPAVLEEPHGSGVQRAPLVRGGSEHGYPVGPAEPAAAPEWSLGSFADVARVLAWVLAAVVLVLLLVAVLRGRAGARTAAARMTPLPVADEAPPSVPDHELLAQQGRFAEAVHALLLAAFHLLSERRGAPWPRAQTGREILRALGGLRRDDEPLQLVFHTAESAHFGRAVVVAERYAECAAAFARWASA